MRPVGVGWQQVDLQQVPSTSGVVSTIF